jgi:putative transposase
MTPAQRQALVEQYRKGANPRVRLRAHILVLRAEGYSWAGIAGVLFCSPRTIARGKTRGETERLGAVLGPSVPPAAGLGGWWRQGVAAWGTQWRPRDCGFLRSRWGCGGIVRLLVELHALCVSPETVRRWLPREPLGWRRPRPGVGPTDPERAAKRQALRPLLAPLPASEIAVFQDEVDMNLNPQIGAMGMRGGQQAESPTPGTNEKRSWAGSLNWRTGALIVTEGLPKEGRGAALFVRQLDDLRRRLLCDRKIPVLCDNARSPDGKLVQRSLRQWGHRLVLHYLPTHAPEATPIERVGWHLHEAIPRWHRCQTLEELLDLVFAWLQKRARFTVEDAVYSLAQAA